MPELPAAESLGVEKPFASSGLRVGQSGSEPMSSVSRADLPPFSFAYHIIAREAE